MSTRISKKSLSYEIAFLEGVRRRCPDNDRVLMALGDLYSIQGRHRESLEVDSELVKLRPYEPSAWYNLACSYAQNQKLEDAFKALERAVALGYDDYGWMAKDPDLRPLRKDARFAQLLQAAAKKHKAHKTKGRPQNE